MRSRYTKKNFSRRKTMRRGGGFFGRSSSKSKTSSRSLGLSNMKVSFSLSYDQVKNGYVIKKNAFIRGPDGKKRKDNTFVVKRFRDFIAFQKDFEKCMNKSKSIWRGIRISNAFRRMNFLNKNTDEKQREFTKDVVSWVQSVISCYQKLEKFLTFKTHRNVSSSKTKSNIFSDQMNSGLLPKRGGAPRYHSRPQLPWTPQQHYKSLSTVNTGRRSESKSRGRSKQNTPFYTIQDPKYSYGEEVNLAKRFAIVYEPSRTTNENKEVYLLQYSGNSSVYKRYSDIDKMRKKLEKQFDTIKKYWKRVKKYGRVKTQRQISKTEFAHDRAERMNKLRNIGIALEKWLKAVMKIKYIVIDTFVNNDGIKAKNTGTFQFPGGI